MATFFLYQDITVHFCHFGHRNVLLEAQTWRNKNVAVFKVQCLYPTRVQMEPQSICTLLIAFLCLDFLVCTDTHRLNYLCYQHRTSAHPYMDLDTKNTIVVVKYLLDKCIYCKDLIKLAAKNCILKHNSTFSNHPPRKPQQKWHFTWKCSLLIGV